MAQKEVIFKNSIAINIVWLEYEVIREIVA